MYCIFEKYYTLYLRHNISYYIVIITNTRALVHHFVVFCFSCRCYENPSLHQTTATTPEVKKKRFACVFWQKPRHILLGCSDIDRIIGLTNTKGTSNPTSSAASALNRIEERWVGGGIIVRTPLRCVR